MEELQGIAGAGVRDWGFFSGAAGGSCGVEWVVRLGTMEIFSLRLRGWVGHVLADGDCDLWGPLSRPYIFGKFLKPPSPNITGQREYEFLLFQLLYSNSFCHIVVFCFVIWDI
jgi:hypothetical protein